MARPPHKLKKEKLVEGVSGLRCLQDLGVKIHKLKHVKLHAKLILADDSRAIIGSINFAPGSFDSRRELAIQVDDPHIIHRIKKTLEHDWENSHPLDLSDAALLEELEDYDPTVREDLAISIDKVEKHHKNGKHLHDKKLHLDKKHHAAQKPHKGTSPPQGA
jgi:cardiolipin synthase